MPGRQFAGEGLTGQMGQRLVSLAVAAGWQLGVHMGAVESSYYLHGWVVASFIVVGAMAVIALGLLEPANIAVLVELSFKLAPVPPANRTSITRVENR